MLLNAAARAQGQIQPTKSTDLTPFTTSNDLGTVVVASSNPAPSTKSTDLSTVTTSKDLGTVVVASSNPVSYSDCSASPSSAPRRLIDMEELDHVLSEGEYEQLVREASLSSGLLARCCPAVLRFVGMIGLGGSLVFSVVDDVIVSLVCSLRVRQNLEDVFCWVAVRPWLRHSDRGKKRCCPLDFLLTLFLCLVGYHFLFSSDCSDWSERGLRTRWHSCWCHHHSSIYLRCWNDVDWY